MYDSCSVISAEAYTIIRRIHWQRCRRDLAIFFLCHPFRAVTLNHKTSHNPAHYITPLARFASAAEIATGLYILLNWRLALRCLTLRCFSDGVLSQKYKYHTGKSAFSAARVHVIYGAALNRHCSAIIMLFFNARADFRCTDECFAHAKVPNVSAFHMCT